MKTPSDWPPSAVELTPEFFGGGANRGKLMRIAADLSKSEPVEAPRPQGPCTRCYAGEGENCICAALCPTCGGTGRVYCDCPAEALCDCEPTDCTNPDCDDGVVDTGPA